MTDRQQPVVQSFVLQRSNAFGKRAFRPPAGFLSRTQGPGSRLPSPAQRSMERLFDTDLSRVRVHVDHEASRIGALSFASGSDIYMAPGAFDPSTPRGAGLLAYELSHVLQQRAGRVKNPFPNGIAIVEDEELEAEAELAAQRAIIERVGPRSGTAQPVLDSILGSVRKHPGTWAASAGVALAGLGLAYWWYGSSTPDLGPGPYTYRQIRDKYDSRLDIGRLKRRGREVIDCAELADTLNEKWSVAIQMMEDVQRKALGCTFRFLSADRVLEELRLRLDPARRERFDHGGLREEFRKKVFLLHTTGGGSKFTDFLYSEADKKKVKNLAKPKFTLQESETVLFPNYLCQVFVEMMAGGETLDHPLKLGATNEIDWLRFGNNLSVFFSLVVGKCLKRNNSGQSDHSRLAVLQRLHTFGDMVFWVGPDLLSLTSAYDTDSKTVERIIAQTVAPYGTCDQLLELFFWQAVAACNADDATPERAWHWLNEESGEEEFLPFASDAMLLRAITEANKLNLHGCTIRPGKMKSDIDSADKLEIKALGMVSGVKKVQGNLGLKAI